MAIEKARIFTGLHDGVVKPTPVSPDLYIESGGVLATELDAITGWDSIPANIRQGWASRTASTKKVPINEEIVNTNKSWQDIEINGQVVIAVGDSGEAIISTNNGSNFTALNIGTASNLLRVEIIDDNNFVVSGFGIVTKTEDGGATWTDITPPSFGRGYGLKAFDGNTIIVSDLLNNEIRKTTDGGSTWTTTTVTNLALPRDVQFYDTQNGFVIGANGYIAKTTDQGANWTFESIDPSDNFFRASVDGNKAAIGGGNGVLYTTDDAGTTWVDKSFDTNTISGLSVSGDIVYVGNTLSIYYSSDFGATFSDLGYAVNSNGITSLNNRFLISNVEGEIIESFLVSGLATGADNARRIAWFYINESGGTYSPAIYDGSTYSYIVTELLNAQAQTGTQKWIKWYPFTDANGYPTSINYDLGGGTQSYCGWGIEYQNENANGYLQNQKLVLIRDFTYPASPDDTTTATVDTLLALTSVNVSENQYSVIRIVVNSSIVTNAVYSADSVNNKPDYDNQITTESTAITTAVTDTILSNTWCEGGILGEGGSGATDGNGLIDNIRFLTL